MQTHQIRSACKNYRHLQAKFQKYKIQLYYIFWAASGARRIGILAIQTAYAVGFYLAFGAYAIDRAMMIKDAIIKRNENNWIYALMYFSYLVPHMVIGPLQWVKMRHVLNFLEDWDAFQVSRHFPSSSSSQSDAPFCSITEVFPGGNAPHPAAKDVLVIFDCHRVCRD